MTADFKLIVRSAAGAKTAEITDHLQLAYRKAVNAPGLASFALNGDHAAIALLTDKCQVEVWRRNVALGIDWYADFYGLFRDPESGFTDRNTFLARCPGQMTMLGWRHIAYPADTVDRSKFTSKPGETIMKQMVKYNATGSGTTGDGRIRNATAAGVLTGMATISNQADGGAGNSLDWYCALDNLLASLQKLARVAGGDFDLIKTGAATWEFRWYLGQRGTDRSATVTFSLGYGNMAVPRSRYNRMDEKTVAIVGGGGENSARTFVTRTGANHAVGNDIEMFVDARGEGTVTAALNARGDMKLDQAQARQEFTYRVLQSPASAYGKHYCVAGDIGDLVKGRFGTTTATQKIMAVEVTSTADKVETIDVEMADA